MLSASGFSSRTALSFGPERSISAMRCKYAAVSWCAVSVPAAIWTWSDSMVASAKGKSAAWAVAAQRVTAKPRVVSEGMRQDNQTIGQSDKETATVSLVSCQCPLRLSDCLIV